MKTLNSFSNNALPLISLISLVLSGCAGTSDIKPETPSPRPVSKQSVNAPVVDYALQFQGAPYSYGNASPEKGFDCSGFVKYVYKHDGIELPRTVKEMANVLQPVPNENVRSGDLLFFNTSGDSISHVGIFMNGTNFIHAPSSKTGKVTVSSLKNTYWRERFVDARRPTKN
ncbi:MAG: C40 family peptidase [Methylococcales bacterium]|nr:C40 family peptidase [Methylococcales bacterium]